MSSQCQESRQIPTLSSLLNSYVSRLKLIYVFLLFLFLLICIFPISDQHYHLIFQVQRESHNFLPTTTRPIISLSPPQNNLQASIPTGLHFSYFCFLCFRIILIWALQMLVFTSEEYYDAGYLEDKVLLSDAVGFLTQLVTRFHLGFIIAQGILTWEQLVSCPLDPNVVKKILRLHI